jgi:hypothetical protein
MVARDVWVMIQSALIALLSRLEDLVKHLWRAERYNRHNLFLIRRFMVVSRMEMH